MHARRRGRLGDQTLKNIARPVRVYAVKIGSMTETRRVAAIPGD
ncbi:MAG: hypothetical protein WAV18_16685 [Roseiarcus sp.]